MGRRFDDPETDDELGLMPGNGRPGAAYFGNTSVMEYEQDYMSPGIGTYDVAYAKAVYGQVLETYDVEADPNAGGIPASEQDQFLLNLALQRAEVSTLGPNLAHYTDIARAQKVFKPGYCRPASPDELQQGSWRVVHGQICSQSPRDIALWRDFENDGDIPATLQSYSDWGFTAWRTKPGVSAEPRERWNYRYGETYGHGYMHTNPSDNGADVYEVTIGNSKMFDLTYPLNYFRRGNKEYFYDAIPSQTADRYFERARSFHWILEGSNYGPEYAVAANEVFHFLARSALTPEPGGMVFNNGMGAFDVNDSGGVATAATFQIALVDGRYASDDFDDSKGGQWDYLSWINHAGYNSEKSFAIRALLDGRPTLYTISRETAIDGRNVMKNFRLDDAKGVDRLIGGLLSEDWETTALWVKDDIPAGDQLPYRSPQMMDLLANSPSRPAGSAPVFPNIAYKTQLSTVVWAYLFGTMNSDITLVNKMRIWLEGVDFIGAIPDAELVKFTDPASGFTYVARSFGTETINGKTVDKGIAARMLQRANDLLTAYGADSVTTRKYVGVLDGTREIGAILWPVASTQGFDN
jgi:hypothetical protein